MGMRVYGLDCTAGQTSWSSFHLAY